MILQVLVALFLVLIALYFFISRRSQRDNDPPAYPWALPFFGNLIPFAKNPLQLALSGYEKFGEVFRLTLFGQRITCLIGVDGHNWFFKASEDELSANQAYKFTVPIFGKNIVYDCEPNVLLQQRKMMLFGLNQKRFAFYVPLIEKEASDYFSSTWGDEGECDLFDAISQVIVLTSTHCLHGKEVRQNMHAEYAELYQQLDDALTPLGLFFPNLPLPANIGRDKARKRFVEIFSKIIKERRANKVQSEDLLQTFMDATYDDGTTLTDDEVVGMLIALMFAGQHTSKVTATWLTLFLLTNKDCMHTVLEEQNTLLPPGTSINLNIVKQMNYLDKCFKESLRLRTPLIVLMRRASKDLEYKGFHIPKGSLVSIWPGLSHHLKEYFTESTKFDPSRFDESRAEHRVEAYRYFPFGGGTHVCTGEQFAYVQVKSVVSYLVRNYHMELVAPEMPKQDFTTMIPGPCHPVTIRYKKINPSS